MLKQALETARLHHKRAADNLAEINTYTLDDRVFEDREKIKTIDAFVFRFIKLQDFMSEKLFRHLLDAIGEYKDSMSLLDVLDKLEKLGLVENPDNWIKIRKLRNQLTHEYPDNRNDLLSGIKLSLKYFGEITDILQAIESYSRQYRLLHP